MGWQLLRNCIGSRHTRVTAAANLVLVWAFPNLPPWERRQHRSEFSRPVAMHLNWCPFKGRGWHRRVHGNRKQISMSRPAGRRGHKWGRQAINFWIDWEIRRLCINERMCTRIYPPCSTQSLQPLWARFFKVGGCLKHKWHFHFKQWASPARYFLCLILRSGRWTKALQKPHLPPKAWDVDSCVRTRHSFPFPAFRSWSWFGELI